MTKQLSAGFHPILDIPAATEGEYSIAHLEYEAGHEFNTANMRTQIFGQPNKTVSFRKSVTFHELRYSGGVWMTDLPSERAQARMCLEGLSGHVLVGGLGLGLAAEMLARRPEVTHVTVVEIATEVVQLIVPHLLTRDKINVVTKDLFAFLSDTIGIFDSAFFDIWQSDSEGTFFETVVPLLKLAQAKVKTTPRCWNEDVMRGQLYFSLQQRLFMLTTKMEVGKCGVVTLDMLCEEKGTIYWDWQCSFWRQYRASKLSTAPILTDNPDFDEAAAEYVRSYGRPEYISN